MANIKKTIQSIIQEIDDVNNHPTVSLEFSGFITTGDGNTLLLSQSIDRKITEVAHYYYQQSEIKEQYTINEWRLAIRKLVGPCYEATDPNDKLGRRGQLFKEQIESAQNKYLSRQNIYVMSFGCSIFFKPLISEFSIGPVTFFPSKSWINYAFENQLIEETEYNCLINSESCSDSTLDKELREQLQNSKLFDLLDDSQIMCTVKTEGLEPELARKRSLIAARLAQTSIALLWILPSRILEGMRVAGDDRETDRRMLVSTPDACPSYFNERVRMAHVDYDDITKLPYFDKQLFDLAGQMIACWTSITEYSKASELLRGLSQALYFFWSGCNDDELMSIVKFTASLEALSPNQNSSAVLNLLKSRLDLNEDDPVSSDKNLGQMVKLIYSQARSRTLHGTNTEILHDWSIVQADAEKMTRYCIVSSMNYLIKNPTVTELVCLSK